MMAGGQEIGEVLLDLALYVRDGRLRPRSGPTPQFRAKERCLLKLETFLSLILVLS